MFGEPVPAEHAFGAGSSYDGGMGTSPFGRLAPPPFRAAGYPFGARPGGARP